MTRATDRLAAVALAMLMTQACSHRAGDFSIMSTEKFDITSTALEQRRGQRVEGEDCVTWPLGFIPTGLPNLQAAAAKALASSKEPAVALLEPVTRYKVVAAVIFNTHCIQVEGYAVKEVPRVPAAPVPATPVATPRPSPTPAAAPATLPGLERGAVVTAKPGARLRTRAIPDADSAAPLEPGATLTLVTSMFTASGKWWYAEFGGRKGWILEGEIEPAPAPPTAPAVEPAATE